MNQRGIVAVSMEISVQGWNKKGGEEMWKSQVSLGQEERDARPRVDGVQTHLT